MRVLVIGVIPSKNKVNSWSYALDWSTAKVSPEAITKRIIKVIQLPWYSIGPEIEGVQRWKGGDGVGMTIL